MAGEHRKFALAAMRKHHAAAMPRGMAPKTRKQVAGRIKTQRNAVASVTGNLRHGTTAVLKSAQTSSLKKSAQIAKVRGRIASAKSSASNAKTVQKNQKLSAGNLLRAKVARNRAFQSKARKVNRKVVGQGKVDKGLIKNYLS